MADELKASPTYPGQEFIGQLGRVAERLGITAAEAMKIVSEQGNSPIKAFLGELLIADPLKSAGTALQDWTGTPREVTPERPYSRLISGKGMTTRIDPRVLDVAAFGQPVASRLTGAAVGLPKVVAGGARMAGRGAKALAPTANQMLENYMLKTGQMLPLNVYHGSPHRFAPTPKNPLGEFDPAKIGTGEGAQAYGHGLYFAESRDVANGYREKLSTNVTVDGKKLQTHPSDGPMAEAHNNVVIMIQKGMAPDAAIAEVKKYWIDAANEMRAFAKDNPQLADRIEKEALSRMEIANAAATLKPQSFYRDPGALYKVDLPDDQIAKMLDWDKPLSEQAEVIKALKGTDYEVGMSQKEAEKIADARLRQEAEEWAEMTGGDPVDYSNNVDWEKYVDQVRKESGSIDSSMTGKDLHKIIMRDEGYRPELFDPENYQIGTSEILRQFGVPGIKYLDQASRGAGEGTRNFVVFPGGESTLNIISREKKGGMVNEDAMRLKYDAKGNVIGSESKNYARGGAVKACDCNDDAIRMAVWNKQLRKQHA